MEKDLTVDVGVLMAASGLGAYEFHDESLKLAQRIESDSALRLALDKKGRVEYQYRTMMKSGTFGHSWLAMLASRNKIVIVTLKKLNRGITTALQEAHFDPEDYKYVETASSTACGFLVSHDPDYSPNVRKILRRAVVSVFSARECNASLCDLQSRNDSNADMTN
jgi:hypothetical protein